ncbi:MAG: LLM class F420-dependent oxidoreductase [Hyphomicrobiales bacterium]
MQVGLHVPQVGPFARPDIIEPMARAADESGFDGLWVFDHVVLQKEQQSRYPYSADGHMGFRPTHDFLEALTLLTYLAGITQRTLLGTSVLVVPMRNPVYLAKVLATMDRLSNGRVVLGAGVGWWEQEYEVLGVPFARRGKRMDECLELMQALWRDEWVEYHGEFYDCVDWTCNPKPANGHIETWLGGESRQQLGRVGKYADGWLATAKSLPTLEQDFAVAQEAARRAGRDPASLKIGLEGAVMISSQGMEAAAEQLSQLAGRGIAHAIAGVNPREHERAPEIIREFGQEWLPKLK